MNLHPSTRGVAERAGCTGLKLQSPEGQRPVCSRKIVGRRVAALRTSNNTPRRKTPILPITGRVDLLVTVIAAGL